MESLRNNIFSEQNSTRKLDQLAAKSHLYARTEKTQLAQAILPVINAIFWPPMIAWNPELKVWSALSGFAVPLLDAVLLEPLQKSWRLQAAKIQELFDCELLGLPWNVIKAGEQLTEECIAECAQKFKIKDGNESRLRNWYSFQFEDLPLSLSRLICQRSNCWWDAKLRRLYANILIGVVSLLAVIAFVVSLASGLTLEKFVLAVVAPIAPVCLWGIREINRQRSAADEGDRLLRHAELVLSAGYEGKLGGPELEKASRDLQNEIYDRRRNSPSNPAWLYFLQRTEYQQLMVKGADELIAKYRAARGERSRG